MNADQTRIVAASTVRELTEADVPRWDSFVETCDEATFFHRAGWRTVIGRSFGHKTHYLFAERDGVIVGVLPLVEIKSALFGHALISNAFSVCGGPACLDKSARAALDARAEEIFRKSGAAYLEYRCPARLKHGWQTRNDLYASFAGPLPAQEDENLKQIPRKQRAVVRKAIESPLTSQIEKSVDNLFDAIAACEKPGAVVRDDHLFASPLLGWVNPADNKCGTGRLNVGNTPVIGAPPLPKFDPKSNFGHMHAGPAEWWIVQVGKISGKFENQGEFVAEEGDVLYAAPMMWHQMAALAPSGPSVRLAMGGYELINMNSTDGGN